jgi:UDP-N-acetylglucosamine 2-epimerase (non-hydrolysing)
MPTALLAFGTRPEAIKMLPLLPALRSVGIAPQVAVTGQHREMLDQVTRLFGVTPDFDLDLGKLGQSLAHITSAAVQGVNHLVRQVEPDVLVVQGDTSTTVAAAMGAFYEQCPVVHVEAGLRTGKRYSPFPEEINRRLTTQLASLHLAPTPTNRRNLLWENVSEESVVVTGNTVIDALLAIARRDIPFTDPLLKAVEGDGRRIVLITTHRRESWGPRMLSAMSAVRDLAQKYTDCMFVLPMHRNPIVRQSVEPALSGLRNVLLTEPLPYGDFARLLGLAYVVLTDSGGVQEEAPSLGKPVLVLRDDTERPEAIEAGTVKLVGTDRDVIYAETAALLDDATRYGSMSRAVNPYGDGRAASRSAHAIAALLQLGERIADFSPVAPQPSDSARASSGIASSAGC